jgi:hypothetical protein
VTSSYSTTCMSLMIEDCRPPLDAPNSDDFGIRTEDVSFELLYNYWHTSRQAHSRKQNTPFSMPANPTLSIASLWIRGAPHSCPLFRSHSNTVKVQRCLAYIYTSTHPTAVEAPLRGRNRNRNYRSGAATVCNRSVIPPLCALQLTSLPLHPTHLPGETVKRCN